MALKSMVWVEFGILKTIQRCHTVCGTQSIPALEQFQKRERYIIDSLVNFTTLNYYNRNAFFHDKCMVWLGLEYAYSQ